MQLARARLRPAIQSRHGITVAELLVHVGDHAVRQWLVADQVVAIQPVTAMLCEVDVVEAGAAVEHRVVDDEAFQVQHAEQFARLHRHAADYHALAETLGVLPVHGGIAFAVALADQAATSAVPIDIDLDGKPWSRRACSVQRFEHFPAGFVVLQIQRHQHDAVLRPRNERKQRFTERRRPR
ncbi:hypothetical protein DYST_03300 [Dyella terrae]|nr:hypothetical protein DYST_03300 [Dyella terrae]